jgi:hypothetical protein
LLASLLGSSSGIRKFADTKETRSFYMSKQRTQTEVIEALRQTGGIITEAAKVLGFTSADSLRRRVRTTPALQEVQDEIREQMKDLAEGNIFKALKDGDKEMSKWYAASQARDRGYGTKIEVEGKIAIQQAPDLSKLSMEELKALEAITQKTSCNTSAG